MGLLRFPLAAVFAVLTIPTLCLTAAAQSHSHGYMLFAPGVVSGGGETEPTLELALGGEAVFARRIGIGVEVGGVGLRGSTDSGFGLGSINGYYHLPRANSRRDPFLTVGYSQVIPFDVSLFNFGGGMNWWFAPHLGMKVVFRDYVYKGSGRANLGTFGFGVAFH